MVHLYPMISPPQSDVILDERSGRPTQFRGGIAPSKREGRQNWKFCVDILFWAVGRV